MKNNTIQGSLQVGNTCITIDYNGKTGVVTVQQGANTTTLQVNSVSDVVRIVRAIAVA